MMSAARTGEQTEARLKAVVLGGKGFLGRALTRELFRAGHDVVAVARQWNQSDLDGFPVFTKVSRVAGDTLDREVLDQVLNRADIVFHAATSTHPTLFLDDPVSEANQSVLPLQRLIESVLRNGVSKIVFPSSGGTVYQDTVEQRSETTPTDPKTPYAIFKLASEQLLRSTAARTAAFTVDIARIANLYGVDQPLRPGQGVLPHWLDAITKGLPVRIYGDGNNSRDYVLVDDVAKCLASSCYRLNQSDLFNVGTGKATTLLELAGYLENLLGKKLDLRFEEARGSDLQSVSLNTDKLFTLVSGLKLTDLESGLRSVVQNIQPNEKAEHLVQ